MASNNYRAWYRVGAVGLVVLAGAWHAQAQAQIPTTPQTWIVDAAYTGTEDGSALRPFNTISEAMAVVLPERGDTVRVRPGSYAESFLIPPGATLLAERGPDETYITGDPESTDPLVALTEDSLMQGFTVGPTGGSGVVVFGGYTGEVRNCIFVDSFAGASVADGGILFAYNNTFHGNQVSINLEPGGVVGDARNNIFSADTVGIFLNEGATATTAYNCFFGSGPAVFGGAPGETDFRANPSLVNPDSAIYHVAINSGVKDRGDPDATFNDRDGSRNDVGADGGPHALADELPPFVVVETTLAKGGAFAYELDASLSFDAWGISDVAWDTDVANGLTYNDAVGNAILVEFANAGRYLVGVRVTDHAGLSSERTLTVVAGSAPVAAISATKRASAAPFRTDLRALQAGAADAIEWDFALDGTVDSRREETIYILPEAFLPGTHLVGLSRRDGDSLSQAAQPLTLTRTKVIAAKAFLPGDTGDMVAATGGRLGGTTLSFPQFSVTSEIMGAIAEPATSDFPVMPAGNLIALVEFGPDGQSFPRRLKASVPLLATPSASATVKVYRWNNDSATWSEDGIHFARVTDTAPARLVFETARLGVFAAVATSATPGNGDGDFVIICNQTGEPIFANAMGDLSVLGMLFTVLLITGTARRRGKA